MAYEADTSKGWGLTPGAASANLGRMAGGGYGSMYGGSGDQSPVYEQRMAQIRGNFATRQAQLSEDRSREEADRANTLAQGRYDTQKDQYEKDYAMKKSEYDKDYLMRQGQYDQAQENWQSNWDRSESRYDDEQQRAEDQRFLSMYGSAPGSASGSGGEPPSWMGDSDKSKWYRLMGISEPDTTQDDAWSNYHNTIKEHRAMRQRMPWLTDRQLPNPNPPGYTPPPKE